VGLPLKKTDRRYTYGDARTWPDDERWELIEGEAWNMSPAPSASHQGLVIALAARIYAHLKGRECRVFPAPFDVLLPATPGQEEDDVDTVVQPDVSVICDRAKITERGCRGAPDWVIEILSPYTAAKDMRVKRDLYERHGVREYWIVDDNDRCVHVLLRGGDGRFGEPETHVGDATLRSMVCDGLEMRLADLFVET
jgi:Uma2 family endonuclease